MMNFTSRQNGFTLLEVMVVVVIIATISGFSVLALEQASDRPYSNQADNLQQWLQQLSDTALLQGSVYGVIREQQHLQTVVYYQYQWYRTTQPEPFILLDGAKLVLPQTSTAELVVADNLTQTSNDQQLLPDIILLPNGAIEPTGPIELSFPGHKHHYFFALDDQTFTLATTNSP